ncbi:MAG: hypothetical protein LBH16_02485 [Treponema sp.]|jgi:hypothetical protein|nr:hypothetical protein [Treponema sp.]
MGQYDSWDNLTNFILKHPDDFEAELAKPPYSVKVKRHPSRPNLVMFRYSQFESDFSNPVVRCCRGSVYNIQKDPETGTVTAKPYLMPFFKFSNYGEKGADPIDWNSILFVRDKLDGSLLKLLKEEDGNDLWTTNGSFDINVEVPELLPAETNENIQPPYTFAKLRDHALRGREEEIKRLPAGWTFMFELISPYNRIIVPYRETKMVLLGCRDPEGLEHTPEWVSRKFGLTFLTPQIYQLKNITSVLAYCEAVDTDDREGVVVQDGNFNRIKLKTDHYRSLFYLKGEDHFSDERLFLAIKQGSIDDAVVAWPEIVPRTDEITDEWIKFRAAVNALCKKGIGYYQERLKECADDSKEAKKRYAVFVLEKYRNFSSFMFDAIKENADPEILYNKIDYKELRNFWLPALENVKF